MIVWKRVNAKGASGTVQARQDGVSPVDLDAEVCEGNIRLEIKPFENFRQINKYTKYLSTIENLRIISESWSEEEGYNMMISLQAPLALAHLLRDMPEVAQVQIDGKKSGFRGQKKMVVAMRTSELVPEPVLV